MGDRAVWEFVASVPLVIRSLVFNKVSAWIERADCPVFGVYIDGAGEVDFSRRPWPPKRGVVTTIGAERDTDEHVMREFVMR
jgi:hypothetical protein